MPHSNKYKEYIVEKLQCHLFDTKSFDVFYANQLTPERG